MTFSDRFTCRKCKHLIGPRSAHWEVVPGWIWCAHCADPSMRPALVYADAADLWRELRGRANDGRSRAAEYQPDLWQAIQDRDVEWHPYGTDPNPHWRAS